MSIKVIIMDIDGTLTDSNKKITPKTKKALLQAQNNGCLLVLASGRPTTGLYQCAKELEMDTHNGLLVSFNGSKISNMQTKEVLFNQAMSIEQGQAVLEHMKKFKVKPVIDKDDYMYVNNVYDCFITLNNKPFNVIEYESRGNCYKLCEKEDLAKFADYPLNKILTAADPEYLQEHYKEMMEPFKDTLSCMFTSDFYFEYTAKGIDKGKALENALLPLGYKKEEMIAFGDAQNDASMLKFVGCGVAMANATDELKAIADEITLSNDEDGIAYSLEKHGVI